MKYLTVSPGNLFSRDRVRSSFFGFDPAAGKDKTTIRPALLQHGEKVTITWGDSTLVGKVIGPKLRRRKPKCRKLLSRKQRLKKYRRFIRAFALIDSVIDQYMHKPHQTAGRTFNGLVLEEWTKVENDQSGAG